MIRTNRKVVLRARPQGLPKATDFQLLEEAVPTPGHGEMLVRVHDCSLAPAIRRWMDATSYGTPIPLGGAIPCYQTGQVLNSEVDGFAAGDMVTGLGAIAEHSIIRADGYTRLIDADGLPSLSNHLSVLGTSGLTAYNGLLKVARPAAGETVLVSAAAGSVGSLVGQIAKIHDCRSIGVAGGTIKCARLRETYGFDAAIDYKGKDLSQLEDDFRRSCTAGVDVYFDNVGGDCLDAALGVINQNARIVLCGMISQYNLEDRPPGPRNLWQLVAKTATMHGFLNRYYLSHCTEELQDLRRWIREGRLTWREHIDSGIENFYDSFMRLFDGSNNGHLILRLHSE